MKKDSRHILIVDDEADIRGLIEGILSDEGYKTSTAANAQGAQTLLLTQVPDLIVLDIWLQDSDKDGLELLQEIKAQHPHIPVVMISGHGTIETAVNAIKIGAYDFIEKPFKADRLLLMIRRALEAAALSIENEALRYNQNHNQGQIVGNSNAIENFRAQLKRAASGNSRVLIHGPKGSGKSLAAQWLHRYSSRVQKPFVQLNCMQNPDDIKDILFGKIRDGEPHYGLVQIAQGGVLLLDNVEHMPLPVQNKVLRLLQDGRFQRLGSEEFTESDIRFIASTSIDLEDAIARGEFREELYHRLNVTPLQIPALKDCPDDILAIARYFITNIAMNTTLHARELSEAASKTLRNHHWPYNARELRNIIESAMLMCANKEPSYEIQPCDLRIEDTEKKNSNTQTMQAVMGLPLRAAREVFEHDYLLAQIQNFDGNISKTAAFIGMERSALHRKIKALQINLAPKDNESDTILADTDEKKRA